MNSNSTGRMSWTLGTKLRALYQGKRGDWYSPLSEGKIDPVEEALKAFELRIGLPSGEPLRLPIKVPGLS